MQQPSTHLLSRACRIFLELAYPEGPGSIPVKKRPYFDIACDQPIESFLPPSPCATGVCQLLRGDSGEPAGFDFRLGSSTFPHLKLRIQSLTVNNQITWVCMVDTHDAFNKETRSPPPGHPDAEGWLRMQSSNRALKERIEAAFEADDLATHNSILREELRS